MAADAGAPDLPDVPGAPAGSGDLRRRVFLGLGSNLGDRHALLDAALAGLPDLEAVSALYETDPVGGPDDQGAFLNLVVRLRTALAPLEVLALCRRLEAQAERVRTVRWGPRTLDVDVLWIDGERIDHPELVVPHPRMFERAFVLAPLEDVGPDVVPAGWRDRLGHQGVRRVGPAGPAPAGSAPVVVHTVADLRARLEADRRRGLRVGFVPTMGALHAGHRSLFERAAADCDVVVGSVFVNPLQFAPTDDLDAYPRTLDADVALAGAAGATLVFAPSVAEMYPGHPEPPATRVHVSGVSEPLEGAHRPGHFDGVATVVAKLFSIVGPCRAYFGEKDWQQLAVVRRMVADLDLPVEVVGCPTVRADDGLALSSRNAYLSEAERAVAPVLHRALRAGVAAVDAGERSPGAVRAAMAAVLAAEPALRVEYAEVVDAATLRPLDPLAGELRLLVAARLGPARLIDNEGARAG